MKFYRSVCLLFLVLAFTFSSASRVEAKDEWIQVKSKNFVLIGNASEGDIKKVGTRLEQFRETFRLLFDKLNFASSTPTNVIVFKSDSYYKNFKPRRADGKIDNFVAGFFIPGEDINYITLAAGGDEADTFETIFHEYVHSIVNTNFGKSEVPAWFNEGLAEYYETFAMTDDQKAKLGLPQGRHIQLLQDSKFIPLGSLFNISNYQLLQQGDHSRSIFYSESWALIHYLIQGGKSAGLSKFLLELVNDVPAEKAFQDAFQTTYVQMEKDLRKYVSQSQYHYIEYTFKTKLTFDADMKVSPVDEATSNTVLGDLLYHINREDDAEPYLKTALSLQPDSSVANTTMGMIRIKQRKFADAKTFLEKATAGDPRNHSAYYEYAFLLSREGLDEYGFVKGFDKEAAGKMRNALRKAIALSPAFTESYELLAFVDAVNNEELDDAALLMKKALTYQPGNQRYALRLAEIYMRQDKLAEAGQMIEKIARTTDQPEINTRAASMLDQIAKHKQIEEYNTARSAGSGTAQDNTGGDKSKPVLRRSTGQKEPTEAELKKLAEDAELRTINEALRKPAEGEQRVIGQIQTINCKTRPIQYTIKTASETFVVSSVDFEGLTLNTFDGAASNVQVGCDAALVAFNAVVTYRPAAVSKAAPRGELKAIEFIPTYFRFMTDEELRTEATVYPEDNSPRPAENTQTMSTAPPPADYEAQRRAAFIDGIRNALQKPAAGQKQQLGYLDRIECTNKGVFFNIRIGAETLRLLNPTPETLPIHVFAPDLGGLRFGCTTKQIEFPAFFIYTDKPDAKAKTAGVVVSVDFVPKLFDANPK